MTVRLNVYVLLRIDSYDRSEVLGAFATPDAAKRAAEESEPGRPFDWQPSGDGFYARDSVFYGPTYSYSVEPFEVRA